MCGIAALISQTARSQAHDLVKMCDAIVHRGPDGQGYAFFSQDGRQKLTCTRKEALQLKSERTRVALGHRRLAITDVSSAASQPMSFGSQRRYWITFNGEIYNFKELRAELEVKGYGFTSDSDTEVLICAYAEWGNDCLRHLNGMFSFVIFDSISETIFAARDRYGVKPLYWWRPDAQSLALASEIKQFTFLSNWAPKLERKAAFDYLNWGLTDHTSKTLFEGVWQLPAGHYVQCNIDEIASALPIKQWYELPQKCWRQPYKDSVVNFRNVFVDAVKLRLNADVEVGAALSGGLDSSSIVCVADVLNRESDAKTMHTFSARAVDKRFDEGDFIDSVSSKTSTVQHMIYPDNDGLRRDLDMLIWHHDEPFGSTSVYAEWRVFKESKEAGIKVVLDGHGADETLAGYKSNVGFFLSSLLTRGKFGQFLKEFSAQRKDQNKALLFLLFEILDNLAPNWLRQFARKLSGRSVSCPSWINTELLGIMPVDPMQSLQKRQEPNLSGLSRAQLTATSLPMQLKWVDRDSMAHSIESRAPFMDYRLIELVLSMPDEYKFDGGVSKRILRSAMKQLLPEKVRNRKDKMGFVTPEEIWVCKDSPADFKRMLKDAVENSQGILKEEAFNIGSAMIDGDLPYNSRLWRMICFGLWMKRFKVRV